LIYSTYLGGSGSDIGTAIALDGGNHAYVTGETGSTDFPTANPTQGALKGGSGFDAFVSEINPAGSTLLFSTYLGGSLNDDTTAAGVGAIGAIAVDGPGASIYVTGNTNSTDFPTVAPFQASNDGLIDAFVAKYAQAAFSIAATPLNPATVSPAGSATSTVTVISLNSFAGNVNMSCTIVSRPSNATSPPSCQFATSPLTGGSGVTSLTVSTTSTTTVGAYTIKVTGTGPSQFQSTNLSLAVAVPDFSIAATTPATVSPGASGTSTVTLTSIDGYASPVNLTCAVTGSGSPLPVCSVTGTTPVTPVASPGATSTVTITTTGPSATLIRHSKFFYGMWLPVVGLSIIGMGFSSARSRRKKVLGFLMVAIVMAALLLLPGCGGSSSGGGGGSCKGCTPAGNYTVTVTGTGTDASSTTHNTTVTLAVN
jgi:hypothetical protein